MDERLDAGPCGTTGRGPPAEPRAKGTERAGRWLCAVFAAAAFGAQAQGAGVLVPGEERLSVRAGAFLSAFDTRLRVDGTEQERSRGTDVDLQDDLGVDHNKSAAWAALEWRFASRHRIGLSYSRFTLDGSRDIDRDLRIGDRVFPVDARVSARLRLEVIPVTYSYSLLKRRKNELALTIGLHWGRSSLAAQSSGSIGEREGSNEVDAKADVPLPLIGLQYDHHFSPRWSAGAGAGYFSLEFGDDTLDYQGSVWSARAYAEYRFARHFGFGAAVEGFRLKVDADQDEWRGSIDYGYVGPQLYVTARF